MRQNEYMDPAAALAELERQDRRQAERDRKGREAHRAWIGVRKSQQAAGQIIPEAELRPWNHLTDSEKEIFRRGGELSAYPDEVMWTSVKRVRKEMGEKAFRKKMFKTAISALIEKVCHDRPEAERQRTVEVVVTLSEMLDVPSNDAPPKG